MGYMTPTQTIHYVTMFKRNVMFQLSQSLCIKFVISSRQSCLLLFSPWCRFLARLAMFFEMHPLSVDVTDKCQLFFLPLFAGFLLNYMPREVENVAFSKN